MIKERFYSIEMEGFMKFKYILDGIGWASVEMEINNKKYYSWPSYISEPLIALLEGMLSIIPNCVQDDELKQLVSFKWYQEPSIDKWSLELKDYSKIRILIEHYDDECDEKSKVEFDETCNLIDFISSVIKSLEALLNTHGLVGYKDTWYAKDFPISCYLKLKHYLSSSSKYPTTEEDNEYGAEVYKSVLSEEIKTILQFLADGVLVKVNERISQLKRIHCKNKKKRANCWIQKEKS